LGEGEYPSGGGDGVTRLAPTASSVAEYICGKVAEIDQLLFRWTSAKEKVCPEVVVSLLEKQLQFIEALLESGLLDHLMRVAEEGDDDGEGVQGESGPA
jgi:hypothetical protein